MKTNPISIRVTLKTFICSQIRHFRPFLTRAGFFINEAAPVAVGGRWEQIDVRIRLFRRSAAVFFKLSKVASSVWRTRNDVY